MMSPSDHAFLTTLLRDRSGLRLHGDKQYLIDSRLLPVARRHGLTVIEDLIRLARGAGSEAVRLDIVEAMTTNETFFFRDKLPFEQFTDVMLPHLLPARSNRKRLRIWCAACSTGQEPYSIAILLKEMAHKLAGWKVEILASDISREVLAKAEAGTYTQFEVQRGLPINLLVKYFRQIGDMWQLDAGIRSMVTFRHFNLLDDFAPLGMFDVVLCRNVLIYFDQELKASMLDRLADAVARDGYISLGAAETVIGLSRRLQVIEGQRALFQPAFSYSGTLPDTAERRAARPA